MENSAKQFEIEILLSEFAMYNRTIFGRKKGTPDFNGNFTKYAMTIKEMAMVPGSYQELKDGGYQFDFRTYESDVVLQMVYFPYTALNEKNKATLRAGALGAEGYFSIYWVSGNHNL